jgi:FkbM family methyltransferase
MSKNSSAIFSRLIRYIPVSILKIVTTMFAKHRDISPWPGWHWDYVLDTNKQITVFRQEIVSYAIRNNLNFYFNYSFQPDMKLSIRLTESVGRNLFLSGCKEPNEFAYLDKVIKPGMVFLDLGANIGLHTILASRRVGSKGTVIAVEPSSREFRRLQANVKLNRLKNVILLNIAASDSRSTATLHIADENNPGQNTLGDFIYPGVIESGTEHVELNSVDNIISEFNIKHIDIVKMDIEGHEFFALHGMSMLLQRDHPLILSEISETALQKQNCSPEQIFTLLHGMGYKAMAFNESSGMPLTISFWKPGLGESILFIYDI